MTRTAETDTLQHPARPSRAQRGLPTALAAVAVALLALSGCAAPAPQGPGPAKTTSGAVPGSDDDSASPTASPSGAVGTGTIAGADAEWTLIALADGDGKVSKPLPAPTLDLRTSGRVSGSTGCNRYSAAYDGTAGALTIRTVLATKVGCATGAALERRYLAALPAVTSATIAGSQLVLRGDGVALTYQRDDRMSTTGGSGDDSSAGGGEDG